jgi:hypothetical protein
MAPPKAASIKLTERCRQLLHPSEKTVLDSEGSKDAPARPLKAKLHCVTCSKWIADFEASPREIYVRTKVLPTQLGDSADNGCPICSAFINLYSPISIAIALRKARVQITQIRLEDSNFRVGLSLEMDSDMLYVSVPIFCTEG